MTDIKRYTTYTGELEPEPTEAWGKVDVVLYADCLAAIQQARSESYDKGWREATTFAAEQAEMRLPRNPQRTSVSAVRATLPRAGTKLLNIYELICKSGDGLTDFEIEEATGMAHQSASAARNVLMNRGLIKDAGVTRKNARGMDAIVWVEARPASKEPDDLDAAVDRHPAGRHLHAVPDAHGPGYCGRRDCLICESDPNGGEDWLW